MLYMRDEHQKFLDSLKVGDKVALLFNRHGYDRYGIRYEYVKITKITPKRTKFVFEGGYERERDYLCNVYPISEETDRVNKEYEKRMVVNNAKNLLNKVSPFSSEMDVIENWYDILKRVFESA